MAGGRALLWPRRLLPSGSRSSSWIMITEVSGGGESKSRNLYLFCLFSSCLFVFRKHFASPCAPCMLRSISGGSSLKGKSCYCMQSSMPTRLPSGAVLLYQSKLGSIERVSLKVQPIETVLFVPRRVAVVLLLPRGEDGAVLLYQSVLSRVMDSQ